MMLEKDIEHKSGEYAKTKGVSHYKFTSPERGGVPDRLLLAPVPAFLRSTIARYVRFIEYKREGQKPTPQQLREHMRLQALGFHVEVVDNVEDGKSQIDSMG